MPKSLVIDLPILVTFNEDRKVQEFLDAQKESTRGEYQSLFKLIGKFTNESGSQILANRKLWNTRKIFEFHKWLLTKGYSSTFAETATGCIRGYFQHYHKGLVFNRQERKRITERVRSTTDYLFDREDMKKLWLNADLKEKWILSNKAIGLRASDFVRLQYGTLRKLKLERENVPISIGELTTMKESITAYPFLDYDGLEVARALLEGNRDKKDTDFILPSIRKKAKLPFIQVEELSYILRELARRSGIQFGNSRVRFHILRKYCIDRLSQIMSESSWKRIVGKKCGEESYVSTMQSRNAYMKALPEISLTDENGLKEKFESMDKELNETKATLKSWMESHDKLSKDYAELYWNTKNTFAWIETSMPFIEKLMKREEAEQKKDAESKAHT
jgi:integrase